MASPKHPLTVILSPTAVAELHEVWQWNAEHYSPPHADSYHRFLKERVYGLARIHGLGKPVSGRPDLRYVIIRRKAKGHGHIVVYRVSTAAVEILHIFHTAQDWQTQLAKDSPNQ